MANLHELDVTTGVWRRITSVTGATLGPAANPADSSIWFLSLYSRGYDLRRIRPGAVGSLSPLALSPALTPAAPVPSVSVPSFAEQPVSAPHRFAFAPRLVRWIPQPEASADGVSGAIALSSSDILGRSTFLLNGQWGEPALWRGGDVQLAWRGSRPGARLRLFDAVERPSESRSPVPLGALFDSRMAGALFSIDGASSYDTWAARYRVGGSVARARLEAVNRLTGTAPDPTTRAIGFAGANATWVQRSDAASLSESLAGHFAGGRAFDSTFQRAIVSAAIAAGGAGALPLALSASYGATNAAAPFYERLALGGAPPALLDPNLLDQRLSMPALPTAVSVDSRAFTYRITLNTDPLALYYWGGSTAAEGERFAVWHRVVGAEWASRVAAIPLAGTPAARGVLGIGESLDAPLRHRVRAYVSLVLDP